MFIALGIATIFLLLAGQLIAFSLSSSAPVFFTPETLSWPARCWIRGFLPRSRRCLYGILPPAMARPVRLLAAGSHPARRTPAAYLSFLSAFRYSNMLAVSCRASLRPSLRVWCCSVLRSAIITRAAITELSSNASWAATSAPVWKAMAACKCFPRTSTVG